MLTLLKNQIQKISTKRKLMHILRQRKQKKKLSQNGLRIFKEV